MFYYWCPTCQCEIDARNVTFSETHDLCGTDIEIKDTDDEQEANNENS